MAEYTKGGLITSDQIGVSPTSLTARQRPFTLREMNIITTNYRSYTTKALAALLGRDQSSVKSWMYRNGLSRVQTTKRDLTYAEREIEAKHGEEMFAQAMAGRKFENASIKPAQPEFIAVMNAKAIERRYSVPEYSGCGSSSVIAMEAA